VDERILLLECTKEKITLAKDDEKRVEREVVPRLAPAKAPAPLHPSSCGRPRAYGSGGGEDIQVQELPPTRAAGLPGGRGVDISKIADRGAAAQAGLAGGGLGDAAEQFQQRAFAGAVATDEADHFAALDFKRDILHSPKGVGMILGGLGAATPAIDRAAGEVDQRVAHAAAFHQAAGEDEGRDGEQHPAL